MTTHARQEALDQHNPLHQEPTSQAHLELAQNSAGGGQPAAE